MDILYEEGRHERTYSAGKAWLLVLANSYIINCKENVATVLGLAVLGKQNGNGYNTNDKDSIMTWSMFTAAVFVQVWGFSMGGRTKAIVHY